MIIFLVQALRVLEVVILIRVLMTWIIPDPRDVRVRWFTSKVDVILKPFRVLIPVGPGFIDAGPVLCLLVLQIVERILVQLVYRGF